MTAKIIALVNQKGGCGKSTLSMNLAGGLSILYNAKVLVIDGDKQNTSTKWANHASFISEKASFPCAVVSLANSTKPHKEIIKFINDYDYIVVDCPPSAHLDFNDSILYIADLAIVPVVPSPADIWATTEVKTLINRITEQREDLLNGPPLISRIIPNMCQHGVTMTRDTLDALDTLGIPKMNTVVHLRTVYRNTLLDGSIVLNANDEKAKLEMKKFIKEVKSILS